MNRSDHVRERVEVVVLRHVGGRAGLGGGGDVGAIGNHRGDYHLQARVDQLGDVAHGICVVPEVEVQDDDLRGTRGTEILLDRYRCCHKLDVTRAADPGGHALQEHLVIIDHADLDHGVHD